MTDSPEITHPVVLLGAGHAHVEVVLRLGVHDLGREIILVSPSRHAAYSGMLPGHIAGEYSFDQFHIDVAALCQRCGITFLETSALGIDPDGCRVTLANGGDLSYSVLSIDIGSTPSLPAGIADGIAVKPIATFTERLDRLDALAAEQRQLRLAVVGQGVAGVEVALALRRRYAGREIAIDLVGRAAETVAERSRRARRLVQQALSGASIAHHPSFDVVAYDDGELTSRDGQRIPVDEVVWTTSSGAPSWLSQSGLVLDAKGFVRVDETLLSLSHQNVFAAGDVASLPEPRPKAGVFAVRQGPFLADNIHRWIKRKKLRPYHPQRFWLVLISLADGRAIADKWGLAICARWVARWKHRIDSQYMKRYR